MMTSIKIDMFVYKALESIRISFDETHNDIIKRIIANNEQREEKIEIISKTVFASSNQTSQSGDWTYHNVHLAEGTKLLKWLKGVKYEAVIKAGAFFFDGKYYKTPSAAAMAVTKGTNVNGWDFWRFYDEQTGRWKKLGNLRAVED